MVEADFMGIGGNVEALGMAANGPAGTPF